MLKELGKIVRGTFYVGAVGTLATALAVGAAENKSQPAHTKSPKPVPLAPLKPGYIRCEANFNAHSPDAEYDCSNKLGDAVTNITGHSARARTHDLTDPTFPLHRPKYGNRHERVGHFDDSGRTVKVYIVFQGRHNQEVNTVQVKS